MNTSTHPGIWNLLAATAVLFMHSAAASDTSSIPRIFCLQSGGTHYTSGQSARSVCCYDQDRRCVVADSLRRIAWRVEAAEGGDVTVNDAVQVKDDEQQ